VTLIYFAGAWLLGIVAAALTGVVWWPAVAAVGVAFLAGAALERKPALVLTALLACGLFVGASTLYLDQLIPDQDSIARHNDGGPVTFHGVVAEEPAIDGQTQRVRLDVREVFADNEWRDASGGVLFHASQHPRYAYGDVIELTGELEEPPSFQDFDYREYLSRQGIDSLIAYPDEARVIERGAGNSALAWMYSLRGRLGDALDGALPEPQAALARGLLLGQRADIPDDLNAAMNTTGTSHLVAISGYNVSLVAALIIATFSFLIGRRRAAVLALVAIAGYTALTGGSPTVVRAAIMGSLFVTATIVGRPTSALASILLAAAIMTGLDPRVIEDVSFQLSFAAIAGLVYLAPPLEAMLANALRTRGIEPDSGWLSATLLEASAVTVAAIVATLPIMALHFERVSLVALFTNLLLVPAFPVILASTALTAITGAVWQPLGDATAWLSWAMLTYLIEVARFFEALPIAAVDIPDVSTAHAAVAYLLLFALGWWLARYRAAPPAQDTVGAASPDRVVLRASGLSPVLLLAAVATIAGAIAYWAVTDSPEDRLVVTVLDVGQGDALLIETPGGHRALVDGGPSGDALMRELGDELPFWERTIDLVALTHPHEDHLGGLVDALDRYEVRQVIAPPLTAETATYQAWRARIDAQGVPYHGARPGDVIDLGDGATLRVLGPGPQTAEEDQMNDASLVLMMEWQDVSFLLTGDIEESSEAALLQANANVSATVLKVPHHGSATSSSAAFLDAVQPSVALVSAGAGNRFGHPSPEVLDRLSDAHILRTDLHGAITLSTDGTHLWIETERTP
jgi:competence protein ComEC